MKRTSLALGMGAVLVFAAAFGFAACSNDVSTFGDTTTTTTTSTTTTTTTTNLGGSNAGGGGAGQGGQLQGGSSQGGAGGAPACAPLGDACTGCLFTSCNATYCTCAASTECTAVTACAFACAPGNLTCVENCFQANPTGMSEFLLGADCANQSCSASCPGTAPIDACQLCTAEHCETELEACFTNPECVALVDCVQTVCIPGPQYQGCVINCGISHINGAAAGQQLQGCVTQQCGNSCP